jgi:hypothetical protein
MASNSSTCDNRSIASLLQNCGVTVFACVWVAIHRNIPDPRVTRWTRFCQNVLVVLIGLQSPEWILGWAIAQFLGARNGLKLLQQEYAKAEVIRKVHRKYQPAKHPGVLRPKASNSTLVELPSALKITDSARSSATNLTTVSELLGSKPEVKAPGGSGTLSCIFDVQGPDQ